MKEEKRRNNKRQFRVPGNLVLLRDIVCVLPLHNYHQNNAQTNDNSVYPPPVPSSVYPSLASKSLSIVSPSKWQPPPPTLSPLPRSPPSSLKRRRKGFEKRTCFFELDLVHKIIVSQSSYLNWHFFNFYSITFYFFSKTNKWREFNNSKYVLLWSNRHTLLHRTIHRLTISPNLFYFEFNQISPSTTVWLAFVFT